jgi:PII-like signaling protein
MLPEKGQLLRIYITEGDKFDGVPLHEWIVREAHEHGMAGATVLRGLEGYGVRHLVHTAKILRLSADLPLVIEIVETAENIERFLTLIDRAVGEGLATIENVEIRVYRGLSGQNSPS